MTNYTIYRLFDYDTGSYVGPEFDRLKDFFDYHVHRTFQAERVDSHWGMQAYLHPGEPLKHYTYRNKHGHIINRSTPRKPGMFRDRYAIKDAYGKNYDDPQELYRIAYFPRNKFKGWRHYHDYDWDNQLVYLPKKNNNKLKREVWEWYFRSFRSTNERRQNEACIVDHGEILVRGKRRNLPSTWDDLPNSCWDTRKSWKHNSKRKHQWKNK